MIQLHNGSLPFAEPGGSPRRLCGSELQFLGQQKQIVSNVNVVERFRQAGGEFKILCACQQSVERAPGSHTIAFEKGRMGGLGSNQVVAAIVGRPDYHVVRGEHFERAVENRRREVWSIAVEGDDVSPTGGCKMPKDRGESCRETIALLRHDLDRITDEGRQFIAIEHRAHDRDVHVRQ